MGISPEIKTACFDLDHTLGLFTPITEDRQRRFAALGDPDALGLRKGIPEFLKWAQEKGYTNFITTTGSSDYAQEVLVRTGIDQYFEGIYEGRDIDAGFGKLYLPIAEKMGFEKTEASAKMVAIGDSKTDQPADLEIVFIHQPGGYQQSTEILRKTVEVLNYFGEGSLCEGFKKLYRDYRNTLNNQCLLLDLLQEAQPLLEYRSVDRYNISRRVHYKTTVPTIFLLPRGAQRIKR